MPTTTLQPGAVTLGGAPPGMDVHTQSAVVGDPPQWADASDATYARVNRRFHDSGLWSGSDDASAPLAVFTPSGSVTAVEVTVRCSSSGAGTAFFRAWIYGTASGSGGLPFAEAEEMSVTRGGTIQTATAAFLDNDEDPEFNSLGNAITALADGATLELIVVFPFPADLTIYEASLLVTTTADEKLVTRLHPRKDAHGPMGSAPRLIGNIPPERIVGGHM